MNDKWSARKRTEEKGEVVKALTMKGVMGVGRLMKRRN